MEINFLYLKKIFENLNDNDYDFKNFIKYKHYYLFEHLNKKLTFFNQLTQFSFIFDEYNNLNLINFSFLPNYNMLFLLYSNGDILFIKISFIEEEFFENFWNRISSSKTNINQFKNNDSLFNDLLFVCNSENFYVNKFFYINFFDNKKILKKKNNKNELNIFTNVCVYLNKKYKTEDLIINYENKLIKFYFDDKKIKSKILFIFQNENTNIYKINLFNYKNIFDLIIIQTENEFGFLTLFDEKNKIKKIEYFKLNFDLNSFIYQQKYNNENVLCLINKNDFFEIFSLFDLKKSFIEIDLKDYFNNYYENHIEIISCFLYENLLLILYKFKYKYFIKIINILFKFNKNNNIKNNNNNNIFWCNEDYSFLTNYVLIKQNLEINIIKIYYDNFNNNNNILLLTNKNLFDLYSIQIDNILFALNRLIKENFCYELLRKIEILNYGLNGEIFNNLNFINNENKILINLIWNKNEKNKKIFFEEIFKNIKNFNEKFLLNSVDYLLFNLIDSNNNNINEEYCEILIKIYEKFIEKKIFFDENKKIILNLIEKNFINNNKINNNNNELKKIFEKILIISYLNNFYKIEFNFNENNFGLNEILKEIFKRILNNNNKKFNIKIFLIYYKLLKENIKLNEKFIEEIIINNCNNNNKIFDVLNFFIDFDENYYKNYFQLENENNNENIEKDFYFLENKFISVYVNINNDNNYKLINIYSIIFLIYFNCLNIKKLEEKKINLIKIFLNLIENKFYNNKIFISVKNKINKNSNKNFYEEIYENLKNNKLNNENLNLILN